MAVNATADSPFVSSGRHVSAVLVLAAIQCRVHFRSLLCSLPGQDHLHVLFPNHGKCYLQYLHLPLISILVSYHNGGLSNLLRFLKAAK
jgi:hypothetical protein